MNSHKTSIDNSPVFLIGPVRSGSTFLRLMLNSHPKINNPGECDFLFDLIGELGEMPDVDEYTAWLNTNRIFQAKNLQIEKGKTSREVISSFVSQLQPPDKVLCMNIHRHFHRVPYLFPNARYIRLLRDPRDVARSCIGMGWVGNVYYGIDIWLDAEKSWDLLKNKISEKQFIEVRYEDIVSNIDEKLTEICNFLNLEYSKKMLQYSEHSTYKAPDISLCYQWKKKYTPIELRLVEEKLGEYLPRSGYPLGGHGSEKPSQLSMLKLFIQNKVYRTRFQINRYGISLYIESMIARKLRLNSWHAKCQERRNRIDTQHLR